VRQTLGHIAAVVFLRHGEDNFHGRTIARNPVKNKPFLATLLETVTAAPIVIASRPPDVALLSRRSNAKTDDVANWRQ
jgi:hypothetical protein